MALRLLLGAAEAGFTQSALYYLSTLYPKFVLGWRMGLFAGMYSVAGAFAGLLAYALLNGSGAGALLKGWQVVFIVEGSITVFVGIVALVLLPSDLGRAWFLTEPERRHAVVRMERDVAGGEDGDGEGLASGGVALRDVVDVVRDWKKMVILVSNVMAVLVRFYSSLSYPSFSSLSIFSPFHFRWKTRREGFQMMRGWLLLQFLY